MHHTWQPILRRPPPPQPPTRAAPQNPFQDQIDHDIRDLDDDDDPTRLGSTTLSINGMEAVQSFEPLGRHEHADEESLLSDNFTVVSDNNADHRKRTIEVSLQVMNSIRQEISVEDTALMIKRLEKAADHGLRRTYVDGQPVKDVNENAPILKVGLSYLPGADVPTVNRLEQTNMMTNRSPDQLDSLWRVNTAGTLLSEFDVNADFSITNKDKTADIVERVKERLDKAFHFPMGQNHNAVVIRGRTISAVTIDSDEVKIVRDLQEHKDQFDVQSTLIEIDGTSFVNLIVRYKLIIQRGGTTLSLIDTKDLLESMMEDVRRLCHRSPLLFRMSTRKHIISSSNTRYGTNDGRQFVTMTTSKGIQEMISLSAAYFNTLDSDDRMQKFIRPRFLQMLVLLLSFLNDEDLGEIKDFLESTYNLKADRKSLELLFLKVLPLLSINSRVFLTSMVPAFEGWYPLTGEINEEDYSHYWDVFISRILSRGYILPGKVLQLGRNPMSWCVSWGEYGFKSSDVFCNLQFSGALKAGNEIPRIDDLNEKDSESVNLTVILSNDEKYTIRAPDYERIICLVTGVYSLQEANPVARHYDLEIREYDLNTATREAAKLINPIIREINAWLAAPQRRGRFTSLIRSNSRRADDIQRLHQWTPCGRLTKHVAMLDSRPLAVMYKLDGRRVTLSDAVGIMAQDNKELQNLVNYYLGGMRNVQSQVDSQSYNMTRERLGQVSQCVTRAEATRQQFMRDRSISDEPITTVIQPAGASVLSPGVWYAYRAWHDIDFNLNVPTARDLHMDARRSVVTGVVWLTDAIIELALGGNPAKFFVSPLEAVPEGRRDDQVRVNDVAVLAGHYVIVAEVNEEAGSANTLFLTNFLKIANVEEPVKSQRGANRQAGGRGANRSSGDDPDKLTHVVFV